MRDFVFTLGDSSMKKLGLLVEILTIEDAWSFLKEIMDWQTVVAMI